MFATPTRTGNSASSTRLSPAPCATFRSTGQRLEQVSCGTEIFSIAQDLPGWVPMVVPGMRVGETITLDQVGRLNNSFVLFCNEYVEPTLFFAGTSIGRLVDSYDDVPGEYRAEMKARDGGYLATFRSLP